MLDITINQPEHTRNLSIKEGDGGKGMKGFFIEDITKLLFLGHRSLIKNITQTAVIYRKH